jgi:anti-sigma B factor antagonist
MTGAATPTAPTRAEASRLTGDLTIQTAADTRATLLAWLAGGEDLEVDLSRVSELDTAGLQVLLLAKREAAQRGRRLRLRALPPVVLEVLHIVGLDNDLEPTGILAVAASANPGQDLR